MAEAGMVGESVIEFVHRNGKGKLITQGYTENNARCTKVVSVDILNKRVTEDIIYKDGRAKQVKVSNSRIKYGLVRAKIFLHKITRG